MTDPIKSDEDRKQVVKRYETYGFVGGAGFGVFTGIVVAGPHFHEWNAITIWLVIVVTTIFLGILGNIVVVMAYSSAVSGFHGAPFFGDGDHGGNGGHHGGGDSGHHGGGDGGHGGGGDGGGHG